MVSVCMATYNGEKYIKAQIESILRQLGDTDELVISDDGSTDKTVSIIKDINDPRICLYQSTHLGVVRNFESALKACRGEYIFLSDQDDLWTPNKILKSLKILQKGYMLVMSDCQFINDDSETTAETFFKLRPPKKGLLSNLLKNSFMGCCMAFQRPVLEKALPFPPNVPMHDWWLGLVALQIGSVFFTNDKLVYYRRHSTNASSTGTQSPYRFREKLVMRLHIVSALAKRTLTRVWLLCI